jgi:integrase/recombinase XerD
MNLQELIDQYLAYRQTLGYSFLTAGKILRAFGRAIGDAVVTEVRAEQVLDFLAGTGPITRGWFGRHSVLLGFYRYAISRGHVAASPLPTVLPKHPPRSIPYIYSNEELSRLLRATDSYQRIRSIMEPVTLRTIVLLLYGTGLRIHEAITLNTVDLDLENAVLTVRQSKFFKTRLVPFSRKLGLALAQYAARRPSPPIALLEPTPVFTTRTGARVKQAAIESCFRRVREQAGVRRSGDARHQPRLHDLRHTFAVHRLISWYREGADVQKLLPQLSVYLGHVSVASTQVYLSMTPELLREANARFERYSRKEGLYE